MNLNQNITFYLNVVKSTFKVTNTDMYVNLIFFHKMNYQLGLKNQKNKQLTRVSGFVIKYITN